MEFLHLEILEDLKKNPEQTRIHNTPFVSFTRINENSNRNIININMIDDIIVYD